MEISDARAIERRARGLGVFRHCRFAKGEQKNALEPRYDHWRVPSVL